MKLEVYIINNERIFEIEMNYDSSLKELRSQLDKIGIKQFDFIF